jgi:hypothetical protein
MFRNVGVLVWQKEYVFEICDEVWIFLVSMV